MASVQVQAQFDASIDQLWQLLADFGGLDKWLDPAAVESCESDGNDVGAVRTIVLAEGGGVVRERLDVLEPNAHRFSYSIIGESPIPVDHYSSTVKLTASEAATTHL